MCEGCGECGGIPGVGSGLTQACTDMVGVYVMYACVGTSMRVQGVHVCEGCTCIPMGAFVWCRRVCGICTTSLEGCGEACTGLWDLQEGGQCRGGRRSCACG